MAPSSRFLSGLVAFAAIAKLASAGPACSLGHSINSIQYCNPTGSITYDNIGFSGVYQDVTKMDSDACTCELTPRSFSGSLSPLDEELSLHFRGPLKLKKFAVYAPSQKKKKRTNEHIKRHVHAHVHKRDARIVTETKTITVYVPPAGTGSAGTVPTAPAAPVQENDEDDDDNETDAVADGDFERVGFYDSEAGTADGLVFLNQKGGQGSGVFDYCFGNSLSYANSTINGGSATPQVLEDILVPSNNEFIIMSDKKCIGNDCGYYQPGIPAYHGFGGKEKIFLFEFIMPEDKNCPEFNRNIPAIWALNAKIARTAQYGKKAGGDGKTSCSCWDSGCGEIDLFETLVGADDYLKTHYHSKQGAAGPYGGGGSPDFFPRPYGEVMQAAVIFGESGSVTIKTFDTDVQFSKTLANDFVNQCTKKISVFNVPS